MSPPRSGQRVRCAAIYHPGYSFRPDAGPPMNWPTSTRRRRPESHAWDGTLIGEFSKVRRIYVPYDQMPPRLIYAFLAAEDHNFFQHGGVDVGGVSRALFKDSINALQGRRPEGGSTITQQVAKNILLDSHVTVGRKLKEAIIATRLERTLSKRQILELYLNDIWLGYRSYGVGAAAYNYFGKAISDLTLAQCAYLAALPKGPENYRPVKDKAAATRRRNLILQNMADLGWATQVDVNAAMAEDLKVEAAPAGRAITTAISSPRPDAKRTRSNRSAKISTRADFTCARPTDPQASDRRAYRPHGWAGDLRSSPRPGAAWGHVAIEPGWQQATLAKTPPSERVKWRAAVVTQAGGAVRVQTADDNTVGALDGPDVAWEQAGKGLSVGDLVFVESNDHGGFHLRQVPAVNGAIVTMDPYTGRVLTMVGGYSFSLSNFNRATQAYRQPGSSFKPFVYATALESGQFTPASVVLDAPISLPGFGGQIWRPENYERRFLGPLVFRRGLELSLNTMTVRIARQVGMPRIIDTARRFGIVDHMDPVLSMALGAGETTPFRMTAAYSSFVNGGRKVSPHLIEEVEDRDGKSVYRADNRDCPGCEAAFTGDDGPEIPYSGAQLIDPITAYQIDTMLEGVVQESTAAQERPAPVLGRPIGGRQAPRMISAAPGSWASALLAADRGRRLRRLRRQPLARQGRDRCGGRLADLHRVHAGSPERPAGHGLQVAAGNRVRQHRPQSGGVPPWHRTSRPDPDRERSGGRPARAARPPDPSAASPAGRYAQAGGGRQAAGREQGIVLGRQPAFIWRSSQIEGSGQQGRLPCARISRPRRPISSSP